MPTKRKRRHSGLVPVLCGAIYATLLLYTFSSIAANPKTDVATIHVVYSVNQMGIYKRFRQSLKKQPLMLDSGSEEWNLTRRQRSNVSVTETFDEKFEEREADLSTRYFGYAKSSLLSRSLSSPVTHNYDGVTEYTNRVFMNIDKPAKRKVTGKMTKPDENDVIFRDVKRHSKYTEEGKVRSVPKSPTTPIPNNISTTLAKSQSKTSSWLDGKFRSGHVQREAQKEDAEVNRHRSQAVVSLQPATVHQCGRPLNGVVTQDDGTRFCARCRYPDNRPILGELFTYYLSRLLGIDNVPPVMLSHVTVTSNSTWKDRASDLRELGWSRDSYVALILWVPGLNRNRMPPAVSLALDKGTVLHNRSFGRHPNCTCTWHDQNSSCTHGTYTGRDMAEVAQWSSMTILDYITANYDRAASSLHTRSSIRNVGQTSRGKFWLFDNEAAFFLSYQLLHQGSPAGKWLERAHSRLLRSTCVFQQNVIQSVLKLQRSSDPADVLEEYVRVHEPLYDHVTVENDASELLREFFPRRLRDVVDWIRHCQVM